jgi:hypothetical protein
MPWRRKRGLGFVPGLVLGIIIGVCVSAVFVSELHNGVHRLQQEELRWRIRSIEITLQARTAAEILLAQTETDLHGRLESLAKIFDGNGNASANN